MDYQPRTIAFMAELLHAPVAPDPLVLQKVHSELFEGGSPPYAGFQVIPGGAMLSNPIAQPHSTSQVALLADRMQFREEKTELTIDGFGARLCRVVEVASTLRGIQGLMRSQIVLRSLVNPRYWEDSREFLKEAVLGLDEELESLGRAPSIYGMRFAFPPGHGDAGSIDLRVESYNADSRSLFLEIRAEHGPLELPGGQGLLERHLHSTYEFLTDRALPFIANFDARAPR